MTRANLPAWSPVPLGGTIVALAEVQPEHSAQASGRAASRRCGLLILALLLFSVAMAAAQQAGAASVTTTDNAVPSSWKDIRTPPLPNWTPAQPKRIELANGLVLFLQEDHELPLIAAHGIIRGGSRSEPASKAGMLEIYGDVWRTGGTGKMTGDQMDDFLEARAAKLETSDEQESTTIDFNCLKGDFDDVFRLFVELLRGPAFRDDKILLAKNELNTAIARRNDSSRGIADREAQKLAYGKNNPYAREPQYATVAAVTRADLLDWYRQHVAPNNMILGLVGDFDSAQMEKKLRDAFAGWPRGPQVKKPEIPLQPAKAGLYVVDKADVNQSEIRFVTLGIERSNPDYFAVQVMNQVLSGGFASRLMAELRTKRGLAYAVGGRLGAEWDHPGIFYLTIATKTATTVEAIQGMRQAMAQFKADPPSESELKFAKDAILNSFIFRFDTPAKVLRERMTCDFYGYQLNFLEIYRDKVEKVTARDVNRVVRKYVHPQKFAVLVVGNLKDFEKPLAALGPATKIDISTPGAAETAASAAPAR
jgi:zinc protease